MRVVTAIASVFLSATFISADPLAHNNLQFKSRYFHRRSDLDNNVFSQKLIMVLDSLDSNMGCINHCLTVNCNTVLHNEDTRLCRLYSGTDPFNGSSHTGWQYYGVSCEDYSLNSSVPNADVLSDNTDDVCDVDYHALITCPPTSCFSQGTWMLFNIVCTPTLFQVDPATVTPSEWTAIPMPFELKPGHVISLQLTGNGMSQSINFDKDNGDTPLHMSIRWDMNPRNVVYNAVIGGSWGAEERLNQFPINDINNYTIDIHIMDTDFKTYGDGDLMMTNQMRMTFNGVKTIRLVNCPTFYKLKVGYDRC